MNAARDEKVRTLYLAGKSRKAVMSELGITNTNVMAGISNRLGLHWSWPLQNRKSDTEPSDTAGTQRVYTKQPKGPPLQVVQPPTHEPATKPEPEKPAKLPAPKKPKFVSAQERRSREHDDGFGKMFPKPSLTGDGPTAEDLALIEKILYKF